MSELKRLPDGNWVNPAHVTCIELQRNSDGKRCWTKLWVKKDAGYGTGCIQFEGDQRDSLAGIVNAGETGPTHPNEIQDPRHLDAA